MATTTLKTLAQSGITAVKAFTPLVDALATNGNATTATYGATNTSLLTVAWTDLADGVYDCVYYAGAIAVGFDSITVSGVNTTTNDSAPTAIAISTQVAADLLAAHGSGSWQTATSAATFAYGVVERSPDDTNPIFFEWPNAADTLTVTRQLTSGGVTGSFAAATGAATFVRTRADGVHLWQLAFNAADRPIVEGLAVYKIVGATYTTERELTLRVAVAGGSGGGGGAVGPGADSVTIEIEDNGVAVPDVSVWISSDSAGAVVIAGTLITNGSGKVTFLLDAGTPYYLWANKSGKVSIQGQSFVAVAD